MIGAVGQVVLLRFPQADLVEGKLRPVLLLARVPGRHGDWLACMLSSQLHHATLGFDEVVLPTDEDFDDTGLKVASLVRLGRLAVVSPDALEGVLGAVSATRVSRLRGRLARWLEASDS
jgi:mRNA interferase MazF